MFNYILYIDINYIYYYKVKYDLYIYYILLLIFIEFTNIISINNLYLSNAI